MTFSNLLAGLGSVGSTLTTFAIEPSRRRCQFASSPIVLRSPLRAIDRYRPRDTRRIGGPSQRYRGTR
jgi:hypothetical protein